MNKYVPGCGPNGAKIAIIGEAPSYDEMESGKPFTGPSGKELDRLLRDAGINRSNCWLTNVSKYFVPFNPFEEGKKKSFYTRAQEAGIDLNEQVTALRAELKAIKPNIILALGGTALWAITGKTKVSDYRGSILSGMGFKTICTYHPAHLLHQAKGGEIKGYWNRQVMIFDMKRVLEESRTPEIVLPIRHLHVAKNSAELYDFIQRNVSNTFPAIDIEASTDGNCVPICVGISFKPGEGITVPLWSHIGLDDLPHSDLVTMWLMLAEFLAKHEVIGQNFGYDRDKIKRLGFIVKALKSDCMLKAFVINPELPKNLAFNTSIYTREPFYKNEGMYEGSTNDLLIGCARDACVTKEIDLAQDIDLDELGLRPFYENFILKLHDLYGEIENHGLLVDSSIRESLIRKYVEWDERIRYELYTLAGDHINTSSPKQVASLIYGNWKLPQRKGTGEEVLTQLLNLPSVKDPGKRRGLELILEDRRVKKTLGTYLLTPSDFDGRMRTSFFYCLDTGRSSTSQQEPPIRPSFDLKNEDNKKKRVVLGAAFQTLTKHGDIGPEIRTMYVADPGYVFLQIDSAQAEARVVFLLAEDYDALKLIDTVDYHALTASWFFGGTEETWSKKTHGFEHPVRFMGKTIRHSGHLGAGKGRTALTVNTDARKYKIDAKITEAEADKALKIFHIKQPRIKQVFQAGVIKCLEKNRRLQAPVPYGIDAPIGGIRTFFERWGDELFRQAFSYIPQRTVSENTKGAALRIRARAKFIKIVMESHDALLLLVPEERANEASKIAKEEFECPIDFSTCSLSRDKLVIPCEVEIGKNYYDFKKFKFLS